MRKAITAFLVAFISLLGTPIWISQDPAPVAQRAPARPQPVNEVTRGDYDRINLGRIEVTAYTAGPESTEKRPGDRGYRITASGAKVKEGRTCAALGLPFGTKVYIEGVGVRVVEDRGRLKPDQIDIFIEDKDRALSWGRQERKAWIIKE